MTTWIEAPAMGKADKQGNRPRAARNWRKRAGIAAAALVVATGGLWFGVNHTSCLGPMLADGLRAVFGPRLVAWAEDTAYAIQDRIDQWRFKGEKPKTFWEPPTQAQPRPEPPQSDPGEPVFFPDPYPPPFPEAAAAGDGIWTPMADAHAPDEPAAAYKSLVHADPRRPYAVLAVVALDVRAFDVHLVAGVSEPDSPRVPMKDRPGNIPAADHAALFAAFNGGFKAAHGQYGMFVGGVEFLPPRDTSCTFVRYRDGRLAIGTWSKLKTLGKEIAFYRQTPPCLVEDGDVAKLVEQAGEYAKGWGATVSGETVIRRSAIALSKDGSTLFYGIGDAMTAQSLARGMKAAGGWSVAELDVNYSYPRFLLYGKSDSGAPVASSSLIPGVPFEKDQYLHASARDFFYLTRAKKKGEAS